MQKVIKITVPKEMADELSRKAKEANITKSAYARDLLRKGMDSGGGMKYEDSKDFRIQLSDKKAERLQEIASGYSMSVREYLTRVAAMDMPPRVHVVVQDIYYVSMELNDLENSIAGVCASIRRTGEVYEQDVKMILKTLKEINDLFDKHLDIELDARNKLYDEAKKKLFSKVRETRKGTFEEWVYCG